MHTLQLRISRLHNRILGNNLMFELNVKEVTMVEGYSKFHLISYNELPQLP